MVKNAATGVLLETRPLLLFCSLHQRPSRLAAYRCSKATYTLDYDAHQPYSHSNKKILNNTTFRTYAYLGK